MELEEVIMNIIISAGEARAFAYEALHKANEGKYDEADDLMKKANEEIGKAHNVQTSLIQKEANGEKLDVSVLFVHAQDHIMTAISEKNLIKEIIDLRKVVNSLINK
ncbi:PTS lactose/cellobiose transporter subunit IIA [Clostridium sp. cel8]|jgi:cellobiose PTS system EIIA component|uniref:PTS lactose/cellobiose transporter subunit IIA n=1 Tax=unclassified Clostridium TaxID=2614128 RepID=UPI0015F69674|nr:PTS lactose/cellobiose transporter subunit IIA [Clostridium sp. cel8]MBA5849970.1 PTS lactose/cellobiose transporter subunit IIA [Clostridium sp. cel8]